MIPLLAVGGATVAGALGAMMLVSGAEKLRRHDDFLGTLAGYRLLPDAMLETAAWALGGLETALGVAFLLHLAPQVAGGVSACLFVVFAMAMAINLVRGRTDVSCGCVPGLERTPLSWAGVGRSGGFVVLSALTAQGGALPGLVRAESIAGGVCLFVLVMTATILSTPAPGEAA